MAEVCAVTDSKDILAAIDQQIFLDDNPASPVNLAATLRDERHGLDTCGPDKGAGGNLLTIFQLDDMSIITHNLRIEQNLYAFSPQDLYGMVTQVLRHHGQNIGCCFDELYGYFTKIQIVEFFFLDTHQLGNSARFLNTRRAAADNNKAQHLAAFFRVLAFICTLEHMEHMVTDM